MDGIILALQFELALCALKALRSDGEGTPISWSDGTMCALCGVLGGKDHWTDPIEREGVYIRASGAAERRRERALRIAEANRILSLIGLALEDWQADSYVLRGKTGKSEVVSDLAALWPSVEKMLGRPLDPLDPETLARRELLNG
jgi:hypothetical protein